MKNKINTGRTINISNRLIETHKGDEVFMEMLALSASLKLMSRESRLWFSSIKEMLQKLCIGYSKWMQFKKHPMFDTLFHVTKNSIVANKMRYNGIQLSLGSGKFKTPKNRLIIKVKKEDLFYGQVLDKIRVAMLVNEVRNMEASWCGGEPTSRLPQNDENQEDGWCPYAGIIDTTMSNEYIARFLSVGLTKGKEISKSAVKDNYVRKFENIKMIIRVKDPFEYIEAHEHEYPIGKLFPSRGAVMWQIPNSWTLVKKGAKNRHYFGYEDVEEYKVKEHEVIRKEDNGFFLGKNDKVLRFLNAEEVVTFDGEVLGIYNKDDKEANIRKIATNIAIREIENWDELSDQARNKAINSRVKALKRKERQDRMDRYTNYLKKSFDKVELLWNNEKRLKVEKELQYATECCEEVGLSIESAAGRIERRMASYKENTRKRMTFDEAKDAYAEMAGELAKGIGSLSKDAYTLYNAKKFQECMEKSNKWDEFKRNLDEQKRLEDNQGETIFADIPVEELCQTNTAYMTEEERFDEWNKYCNIPYTKEEELALGEPKQYSNYLLYTGPDVDVFKVEVEEIPWYRECAFNDPNEPLFNEPLPYYDIDPSWYEGMQNAPSYGKIEDSISYICMNEQTDKQQDLSSNSSISNNKDQDMSNRSISDDNISDLNIEDKTIEDNREMRSNNNNHTNNDYNDQCLYDNDVRYSSSSRVKRALLSVDASGVAPTNI